MGVSSEGEGCAAERMWRSACAGLRVSDRGESTWRRIVESSPPDSVWHSLRNCVAYQAGVWLNLLSKDIEEVTEPAVFKVAMVLRHTPSEVAIKLLNEVLKEHPNPQAATRYALALLTDDEATRCACLRAPLRDLQLFGDSELGVMAASREEYDAHAALVRQEYAKLTQPHYVELRIKVLNQFSQIPKLFHTVEFECFELAARENVEREICTLREHLLTGRAD